MEESPKLPLVDRRRFSKVLAMAPLCLAASSRLEAQQDVKQSVSADGTKPQPPAPKKQGAVPKRPPIKESDPFSDPLVFTRSPVSQRVQPFPLHQVQLEPGPFQQTRDWSRGYMLRLTPDRLLHNFRVTAGLPTTAQPLGGWEDPKSELRGHFVGHYLSACASLAASGDAQIKTRGDAIVAGIAVCQQQLGDSGYVSAFPVELFDRLDQRKGVWAPFYTLHKIMAGLLDMYEKGGNQQALEVLLKLAAWTDSWTASKPEAHMQEILRTEYGAMNEVLYNLSAATGDDRWARAGDRFTKKAFFTPLAMRRDELRDLHANTHIPQVIGASRRYELSSDYRFRDVAEFFWETVVTSRTYVTGGSSNAEAWLTQPNHLAIEYAASSHHQECCCAYNMMKLTRHLYSWTGDPRYIDFYERNLYNHRLGAIEPETGHTTYFLSMTPGAWKTLCTEDQTFWCCTGSAIEEYAKLNDSIYFHDGDSLYVNLFIASRLDWRERGVKLTQTTTFPQTDSTTILVEASPASPWTMRLRIPAWTSDNASILIDGHAIEASGSPGSYVNIKRRWKAGDRVELTMPMRVTVESLRDDARQIAFLYGPLVLAGQYPLQDLGPKLMHENQGPEVNESPIAVPALKTVGGDPSGLLQHVPGSPLHFRITNQSTEIALKPLNESWQRFAVYWTLSS